MPARWLRWSLTTVVVVAGSALSGCGILGNPSSDKAKPTESAAAASPSPPVLSVPVAGQCHGNNVIEQISVADDRVVPCTEFHMAETAYVGRFVGVAALGNVPLLSADASAAAAAVQNEAYQDCASHANTYLGHSWIHRLVTLKVTLPDNRSWRDGDRWYRCDLYELEARFGSITARTGSMKTNWPGAVCINVNLQPIVDCKTKHPGEFVGGFMVPATTTKEPTSQKELQPYLDKCWKVMAPYLGVAIGRVRDYVGVWAQFEFGEAYLASGRRVVWCYTWTGYSPSTYVTGSAKGRKGKGL